jgi:hypothetical protein
MMGACKCARVGGAGVCCGGSWLKLETNKKHNKKRGNLKFIPNNFVMYLLTNEIKPKSWYKKCCKNLWFESVEFEGNHWRVTDTLPSSGLKSYCEL